MASAKGKVTNPRPGFLSRYDFPKGFVFGTGSSAFQFEGAVDVDGRGPSIWDTFIRENHPQIVEEGGLNAIDHYRRYKDDVKIIKEMGWDSYRFSISWSRVLPEGRRTIGENGEEHGVNKLGVEFYNNLINELIANGIEPMITLYHWDLPQALETEYYGFLDKRIKDDFVDYADLCFREFGDRVKNWVTLNEPWSFSLGGYQLGTFAPGRGASSENVRQAMERALPSTPASSRSEMAKTRTPKAGDPTTEPYIVTHNQLLAHAAAVKLYREKYQKVQNGRIGITLVAVWAVPYTDTEEDIQAAKRSLDFQFGWFMDPIINGKYPDNMIRLVGNRLPKFEEHESKDLINSFDFIGINNYTSNYSKDNPPKARALYSPDAQAISVYEREGVPIGEQAGSDWLYVYPKGLRELLLYIKDTYGNPLVYITENGVDELRDDKLSIWESLYDNKRIHYFYTYLSAVKEAIDNGANVKGYYAWSLMDNLEWGAGFYSRFGINFIHFKEDLGRFPKLSAGWFKFLLEKDA